MARLFDSTTAEGATPKSGRLFTGQPQEKKKTVAGKALAVVGKVGKEILKPVATIAARPGQAAFMALNKDVTGEQVDEYTKKVFGDWVAPVPKSMKDVPKDVGAAIQTVALGLPTTAVGTRIGGRLLGGATKLTPQALSRAKLAGNVLALSGEGAVFGTGSAMQQGLKGKEFAKEVAVNAGIAGGIPIVGRALSKVTGIGLKPSVTKQIEDFKAKQPVVDTVTEKAVTPPVRRGTAPNPNKVDYEPYTPESELPTIDYGATPKTTTGLPVINVGAKKTRKVSGDFTYEPIKEPTIPANKTAEFSATKETSIPKSRASTKEVPFVRQTKESRAQTLDTLQQSDIEDVVFRGKQPLPGTTKESYYARLEQIAQENGDDELIKKLGMYDLPSQTAQGLQSLQDAASGSIPRILRKIRRDVEERFMSKTGKKATEIQKEQQQIKEALGSVFDEVGDGNIPKEKIAQILEDIKCKR